MRTRVQSYAVTPAGKVRRGAAVRDELVIGVDKPNATNTGAYLTGLPAYNAATTQQLIITTDDVTIQNMVIYGDIIPRAENLTLRGCILRGGPQHPNNASGIVDCNNGNNFNTLIEDCTIFPQRMSFNRDGIVGHEYTARRNNIYNTTDGLGAFITTANGTNCNVSIEGNYVHDLAYFYPDAVHSDGTHNDGCQIQGGANIHLIGNYFLQRAIAGPGSGINPNYPRMLSESPTHANGAGTIIQKQSSTAPLVNVVVEKNWYSNGNMGLNMKPGTYTVRNNRFSRDFYDYTASSMYVMRGDDSTTTNVIGLNSNIWEDTGAPLLSVATGGTRAVAKTSNLYTGIRWNNIPD